METVLDFIRKRGYSLHMRQTMYEEPYYEIWVNTPDECDCLINAFPDADFRIWKRSGKVVVLWYF